MKKIIALAGLLFAGTVNACPDLTGSWSIAYEYNFYADKVTGVGRLWIESDGHVDARVTEHNNGVVSETFFGGSQLRYDRRGHGCTFSFANESFKVDGVLFTKRRAWVSISYYEASGRGEMRRILFP